MRYLAAIDLKGLSLDVGFMFNPENSWLLSQSSLLFYKALFGRDCLIWGLFWAQI